MNALPKQYEYLLERFKSVAENIGPKLPYHNFQHIKEVYWASIIIAEDEEQLELEQFLLGTAALFHDVVYVTGRTDNEEQSAKVADRNMRWHGCSTYQRNEVKRLIMATKIPTRPKDLLEKILCDADLSYLGNENFLGFLVRSDAYRREVNADEKTWYCKTQPRLLSKFRYYTKSARQAYQEGVKQNFKKILLYGGNEYVRSNRGHTRLRSQK